LSTDEHGWTQINPDIRLFSDRQLRTDFGARAQAWAEARRGALDATLAALAPFLAAIGLDVKL